MNHYNLTLGQRNLESVYYIFRGGRGKGKGKDEKEEREHQRMPQRRGRRHRAGMLMAALILLCLFDTSLLNILHMLGTLLSSTKISATKTDIHSCP